MVKINKYGCRPSGDVCMEHQSPLITFGICEDSPELQSFIEEIKKKARREGRLEGLKEMDDRWLEVDSCLPETFEPLYKLRQEYQQ